MTSFQIRLAGKKIEIHSSYAEVQQLCEDYLCGDGHCVGEDRAGADERPAGITGAADLYVTSTREKIEFERCKAADGRDASDAYLETLAIYREIVEKMLPYSVFLMHGSVVATDGSAFMFTATSGTGKTTRARAWLKQVEGSIVVNGDKPLLKVTDQAVYTCGTPWCGKENLNTNVSVPLSAVILLERAERTSLEKISFSEAFPALLRQTYRAKDSEKMAQTLALLRKLGERVEIYRYRSNLDDMDMKKVYETVR